MVALDAFEANDKAWKEKSGVKQVAENPAHILRLWAANIKTGDMNGTVIHYHQYVGQS